jgi:hypothetical protein
MTSQVDILTREKNYVDIYGIAKLMVVEASLFAAFIIIAWMRYLKFLKIPPYTGPAAVSILEVTLPIKGDTKKLDNDR